LSSQLQAHLSAGYPEGEVKAEGKPASTGIFNQPSIKRAESEKTNRFLDFEVDRPSFYDVAFAAWGATNADRTFDQTFWTNLRVAISAFQRRVSTQVLCQFEGQANSPHLLPKYTFPTGTDFKI
jgi:hypothetical protein